MKGKILNGKIFKRATYAVYFYLFPRSEIYRGKVFPFKKIFIHTPVWFHDFFTEKNNP